jgi:hypothetical protein
VTLQLQQKHYASSVSKLEDQVKADQNEYYRVLVQSWEQQEELARPITSLHDH